MAKGDDVYIVGISFFVKVASLAHDPCTSKSCPSVTRAKVCDCD